MANNKLLRLWLGCLFALLSACSVAPVEPGMRYSRAAMDHLYGVERWSFEGRLALTGQADSWSASISWEHNPGSEKIKLSGPLGQGGVVISLAGNVVTLDRGGDDVQTSTQPEEFINQQLGMFVPVQSLRYWVVGLPEPSSAYKDTNDGFNQNGWLNEYKQMQAVNDGFMPHKMTVMNNQVKLKLVIDRWILQ
ncbi:MAG: lipoprotein insertase outer membrane protein LolB [Methylobacter sp.]